MKRTSAPVLGAAVLVGLIVGFAIDYVLTTLGQPTLTPSLMLPITLVLLGTGVLIWTWTIRRDVRDGRRPDPFRAVRALALSKASSMLGALMAGFGGGLALFVFTRPVLPAGSIIFTLVTTVLAAVALTVAALVAESFCVLPPDDPELEADNVEPFTP